MSENLSSFLVDLASDPDRMARFKANPVFEMAEAGLSEGERAALLARDSRRLNDALSAAKRGGGGGIIQVLKKKKGPPKKRGPKKGPRKGPGKKR